MTIVPMVPGRGRPEPPAGLDRAERRAWADVIDALPSQWLDTAGQLILRHVAAQTALADRLADRLRDLGERGDEPEALEAERQIAAMHRDALKAIAQGLGALRATPQSRMASREGRSRFERSALTAKPWEIVAGKRPAKPDGGDGDEAA
jgi:hypothetical protein